MFKKYQAICLDYIQYWYSYEILHCQEIRYIGNMYVFTQKLQPLVGANLTIKWGSIRT